MDWLLTVPLLLIEILLVMKLDDQTFSDKAWTLGVGSALMIASGFLGTLAGALLLGRMPEETFRTGFRIVMTALAVSLILRGATSLLAP